MVDPDRVHAALALLGEHYAASLPEKLGKIDHAWEGLARDGWDARGEHELGRLLHNLAGSGKTFGFARVSAVARALGDYLGQVARANAVPDEGQGDRVRDWLAELREAARERNPADDEGRLE